MITCYGSSDDLVEWDGCDGADEFNIIAPSHLGPIHWVGTWRLDAPDGSAMKVHVLYDGEWAIAPAAVDEDASMPSWPWELTDSTECGYSMQLTVDAPDGTRLSVVRLASGPTDDD